MNNWRLIPLKTYNAALNMAIDETLIKSVSMYNSPNTIRFYRWNPSAVSIGYFQSLKDEVDLESCHSIDVDVVRRITGGGAVYHDFHGEITYSIIAREEDSIIPKDIMESYQMLCGGIINGLQILGLNAEFKPINDILINGRKISGNAQTRRMGCILQHGTILVDLNIEKMFTVLKVGAVKISDKMIQNVKERVTSIRNELPNSIDIPIVYEALVDGFQKMLVTQLLEGDLTSTEAGEAQQIAGKYASVDWLHLR